MNRDLANPLQSLIAGAAKSLPATTGTTAHYRARLEGAGAGVVILADVSSSMNEACGQLRKIDVLRNALAGLWPELSVAQLVAFSSTSSPIDSPDDLPRPNGGTALHLGLDAAAQYHPAKTVVVSDGRPDSEAEALAAADRLRGIIDVIYCGPDSDVQAIEFMYRLARTGGGRVVVRDISRNHSLLAPAIRVTLGLPAPKGH
jgi:hypothetical protein